MLARISLTMGGFLHNLELMLNDASFSTAMQPYQDKNPLSFSNTEYGPICDQRLESNWPDPRFLDFPDA